MPYPVNPDGEDYRAKEDAHTLQEAEKIKADKKRLRAATKCLEAESGHTEAAHKNARKALESKTKKRLKKTFEPESAAEDKAEGYVEE